MSDASVRLEPALDQAGFARAVGANERQVLDIASLRDLLVDWNGRMNLVGASTLDDFWSRHALDSAQLMALAPAGTKTWADLGAGAGFPGLVLAILLKGVAGARVHLVESVAKRCRFLSEAVSRLDLPAEVHNVRAEDLKLKVDVVTARAVAPLSKLLGYAAPYMTGGAVGLFLKGQDAESEIAEARAVAWRFKAEVLPSLSDPRGRILRIEDLSRG